ncbi:MAG: response regulator [Acidobacteria bacterium]|nr:response regulator [Acidobacteriota bacterium]
MDAEGPVRVLLVEDNHAYARLVQLALADVTGGEFSVVHVERLRAAEDALAQEPKPDVVLLDLSLPDASGLDTVRRALVASVGIPVLVLTGMNDESMALTAVRTGAQDYLLKENVDTPYLVRAIRYALERRKLTVEREQLIVQLQEALAQVKRLTGLLPICIACKRVRDDQGYWKQIETFVQDHSEASFTHGICPQCGRDLYGDLYKG